MARLIPWALPTIPGDSEGGYTPQPTPGPVRVDAYDFSGVVAKREGVANRFSIYNGGFHDSLTGIKTIDTVGVSSVQMYLFSADGKYALLGLNPVTLAVSKIVAYTISLNTKITVTKYRGVVYNAAGEIMQDYEKVVS